jgi:hypothetical protein
MLGMHSDFESIPVELKVDGIETHGATWGEVVVRHLDLPAGVDFTPLLKGLPEDRCQCPHWGLVLEGAITVRYADGREETTHAGEAYYWPGNHTGWTEGGVVFLEFSPAEQIQPVLAHLAAQLTPSA